MASQLHENPNPANPRASRRWEGAILVAIFSFVALLVLPAFTARRESTWIDPIIGSMKLETQWFGHTTATVIDQSAIERWINEHDAPHSNHWKFLHATERGLLGFVSARSCAMAPPIYFLQTPDLDDRFVRSATSDEITAFIHIMQMGNEDEKKQAVDATILKAMNDQPPPAICESTSDSSL